MLLFLSILGIFLSVILLYFNARKNASAKYLGVFFLQVSLYGFYQYVLLYSKSVFLLSLFLFNIAIVCSPLYLIGPMLYWYIRSVLTDNSRLKRRDIWHLLPMIIFFIATIPHAFVPWHEKVEAARTVIEDAGFMEVYRVTLLSEMFSPALGYLTRPILALGYTIWSAGLVINFLIKKKASEVLSKQHFMKKWLCLILGFLLILEVTQIFLIIKVFTMDFSELFFTLDVLRIISVAGLIGLLISPFLFPAILYGLPRIPESNSGKVDPHVPGDSGKKANHFESDYLQSIDQTVTLSMKEHQPYLQPDFNMVQLSVHTQIPVHHLSYYFREEKKQHFNDYRNEWRINHAKNLIRKGKANEFTLETIGLLSGFSTRNTFLTAFKKVEGITPSMFAAQTKNSFHFLPLFLAFIL
jgi:AraC-like DNA-binding protein